jgi:hypothetical protein
VAEGRRKSHCPAGHAYVEGNIYHLADGGRVCKTCTKERRAAVYADRRLPDGRVPRILKAHCPQGHAYQEGSFYQAKGGVRLCKVCTARKNREYFAKRKAERAEMTKA